MVANPAALFRHLRRLVSQHHTDADPDPALLERFVRCGDEGAFAVLVGRHGPLVLRVCQRVLADPHAAEDAFQATFLVLARRAAAIRRRQRLAGWLHGVAYRGALKARAAEALHQCREAPSANLAPLDPHLDPLAELSARELLCVLDEEVQRLPEVYRLPVLLCCLEGHTQEEAARLLGWTAGSVRGRLERGRGRLRDRLARRGLTLPAALAVVGIGQGAASAGLSAALAEATGRAAVAFTAGGGAATGVIPARVAALAEGGLKGMVMGKVKIVAGLVLLAGVLVGGTGLAAYQARTATPPGTGREKVTGDAARDPGQPEPKESKRPRTDRLGDPLPDGVLARMGSSRLRHNDSVLAVRFSPDGKYLASVGHGYAGRVGGNDLRVWDAATGKLAWRLDLGVSGEVVCNLSAAGITVVGTKYKANNPESLLCQVFDPTAGQLQRRVELKDTAAMGSLAISPGGRRITVLSEDADGWGLRLYDLANGQKTLRIPVSGDGIVSAAFAPDGKTVAVCNQSDTLRIHDATSGQIVRELRREKSQIVAPAFSPDGRCLISFQVDLTKVKTDEDAYKACDSSIWDLTTGKERHRLRTESGQSMWSPTFSPDSRLVAMADESHVYLWDLSTGKEVRRLRTSGAAPQTFSPDGKVLAMSSGNMIWLWDVATGQRLPNSADPAFGVSHLRFSRDGQRLIGFAGVPIAWDVATGRELRRFPDVPRKYWTPVSPDESLIAAAGEDGTIRLHDAETGKEVRALKGHEGSVMVQLFSADGRRLYSSGWGDGTVRVWEVATGRELLKLTPGRRGTDRVAVSPDGRWLAAVFLENNVVMVWDLTTGREARQLQTRYSLPFNVAFSPDSRLLAAVVSGSHQKGKDVYDIEVWEVASGKEAGRFVVGKETVRYLTFSPDGRTLATSDWDYRVHLWELASGRLRGQFNGHESYISSIAFSPDGRVLAASSPDAPVYLWDVAGRLEQPRQLTPAELEQAWTDLRGEDAPVAFRAVQRLAAAPEQAVPFLKQQVRPTAAVDAKRLTQLIADLDSERFEVRQQATAELEKLGELAEPALRKALEGQPAPEARRRLEQLVEKLAGPVTSPNQLRALRAVEVLEWIGTSEARQVLEGLTKGVPEARLTREAKAALERLARRAAATP